MGDASLGVRVVINYARSGKAAEDTVVDIPALGATIAVRVDVTGLGALENPSNGPSTPSDDRTSSWRTPR
jgi:hypothetical protein